MELVKASQLVKGCSMIVLVIIATQAGAVYGAVCHWALY